MHVENVYIKCSIEHLRRLEEQRSLSAKIFYTRDERLIISELLFGIMSRNGTFKQNWPAPTEVYHTTDPSSLRKVKSIQASHGYPRIYITVHRQAILLLFVESGTRKLRKSWNPGQNFSLKLTVV